MMLACEDAASVKAGQFFESIAIACTRRQKRHQSDRFQQMLRIGSRHVKNQPFLVVLATASFGQGIILKLEKAGLLCFLKTIKSFFGVRPRRDHHGLDLISDALPFGRLWYTKVGDAVGYAQFYSHSHDSVIRVYDPAGYAIETHEHKGDFKE